MNSLKEAIKKLESSTEFKKFKDKDSFLLSAFLNLGSEEDLEFTPWEINYFSKKDSKVHSFLVSEDIIAREPDQLSLAKEEVKELEIEKVKLDLSNCLIKVKEIIKNKYKHEAPNRIIIILQKIDDLIIWNFTYITNNLNVINIKINALSGEVTHENMENILNFRQDLK